VVQGVSRGEQLTLLRNDLTSQEQQSLVELVRRNGQVSILSPDSVGFIHFCSSTIGCG
jgi:hypothetical protein